MKEIIDLSLKILFIPIPLPITFLNIKYYNLFSIGVLFFFIWIITFIINKLTNNDVSASSGK